MWDMSHGHGGQQFTIVGRSGLESSACGRSQRTHCHHHQQVLEQSKRARGDGETTVAENFESETDADLPKRGRASQVSPVQLASSSSRRTGSAFGFLTS